MYTTSLWNGVEFLFHIPIPILHLIDKKKVPNDSVMFV